MNIQYIRLAKLTCQRDTCSQNWPCIQAGQVYLGLAQQVFALFQCSWQRHIYLDLTWWTGQVKLSNYRLGQAHEARRISRHSAREGGKVVSRMLWVLSTPPGDVPGTHLWQGGQTHHLFRVGTVDVIDVGPVDILVCLVLVVKELGTVQPT